MVAGVYTKADGGVRFARLKTSDVWHRVYRRVYWHGVIYSYCRYRPLVGGICIQRSHTVSSGRPCKICKPNIVVKEKR